MELAAALLQMLKWLKLNTLAQEAAQTGLRFNMWYITMYLQLKDATHSVTHRLGALTFS